jgi:hypothetical protein
MHTTNSTNGGTAPSAFLHKQLDITQADNAVDTRGLGCKIVRESEAEAISLPESLDQVRERLELELRSQAEQIKKLEQSLQEAARQHGQLAKSVQEQLEALRAQPSTAPVGISLDRLLAAVQNLAKAISTESVFDALTEEILLWRMRSAVFSLRENKALCSSARGFKAAEEALKSLVMPLDPDGPFRRVLETGSHVETSASGLKSRDLLEAFEPSGTALILLLPIRTGGSVSAILYSDSGEGSGPLPVEALKILAEFASAQLDRHSVLAAAAQARAEAAAEPEAATAPVVAEQPSAPPAEELVASAPSKAVEAAAAEAPPSETPAAEAAPAVVKTPPAAAAPVNLEQLNEADQRVHKDAKRFSRLLVSEIELYNKTKVAEGRKNHDLYRRLKTDIERSRQTYQKRFGNTVAKQVDYFHEELVRSLAQGDPSLLGSDYPGPMM